MAATRTTRAPQRRRRNTSTLTPAELQAIEERRARVSDAVAKGMTYRAIGEIEGVNASTICRDVDAIREQWRARSATSYGDQVAAEEAKIDLLERDLLARAIGGNDEAVRSWIRLAQRRARLKGLDRPFKLEHSLTPEQTADLVTQAIRGVLSELQVAETPEVGELVARHLTLVADRAEAV